MGPPGTGGLAVSSKWNLDSFIEGGTGSNSDKEEQPQQWPDKFESGTQNYWGLAGFEGRGGFPPEDQCPWRFGARKRP